MKFLAVLLTGCLTGTALCQTEQKSGMPKSIHQLFMEDQEDIPGAANGILKLSSQEYNQRLQGRKAKVRAMLAAGQLKTGNDFEEAAFIFQHGDNPDDCLFAHVLAMEAVLKGDESAKWIEAATLDRYLQAIKQPQVFGTQYPLDPNLPHQVANPQTARFLTGRTLEPYNEQFLPDSVRFDFCVPALAQEKQNVAMFNSGKRPRGTMRASGCRH